MSDIDEKLSELREAVGISSDTEELYQMIRRDVLTEIQYQDLSIFRILSFLLGIWQRDRKLFGIAFMFLANPLKSIRDIATMNHESPSSVWGKLSRLAAESPQISLLMEIRRRGRK